MKPLSTAALLLLSLQNNAPDCSQADDESKKAKRAERFGGGSANVDETKKKQRMERFGLA